MADVYLETLETEQKEQEEQGIDNQPEWRSLKDKLADPDAPRCPSGKMSFASWGKANQALRSFKNRRDNFRHKGLALTVIHCQHCRYYHVGNSNTFNDNARRKARQIRHARERDEQRKRRRVRRAVRKNPH